MKKIVLLFLIITIYSISAFAEQESPDPNQISIDIPIYLTEEDIKIF